MSIGRETRSPRRAAFKWTVEQYERLADLGVFQGRRVELIDGEIVPMSPQEAPHAMTISLISRWLFAVFPDDLYWVRCQAPLAVAPDGAPEPDLAVVRGSPRSYPRRGHPTTALLVIEVSASSLDYDREDKAALYALAGIPDYWIVNLVDRVVEVRRRPEPDAGRPGLFRYAELGTIAEGAALSPLVLPGATIEVAELLP